MTDTDDAVFTETPDVRATVLEHLRNHPEGLTPETLVAAVVRDADTSERVVTLTLTRLEETGMIYHANDRWKVTDP